MTTQQGSRATPVRITVPLSGRTIIRAPFLIDMRSRLSQHCTPRWEAGPGVWTVPRVALRPVMDEVLAAFERAAVSIEVQGEGRATDWLTYGVGRDQADRLPDELPLGPVSTGRAAA